MKFRGKVIRQIKGYRFFLFAALILIVNCTPKPRLSFQNQLPAKEPFIDYDRYIQQDLLYAGVKNDYEALTRDVISALNEMGFSVDSVIASENYVFVRTPFTFKPDYFNTPKHQFLKISLMVEIPRHQGMALQIKYAVCTTCARCEEWYCDDLPLWTQLPEYRVAERIQKLIFDFKEKLKKFQSNF